MTLVQGAVLQKDIVFKSPEYCHGHLVFPTSGLLALLSNNRETFCVVAPYLSSGLLSNHRVVAYAGALRFVCYLVAPCVTHYISVMLKIPEIF